VRLNIGCGRKALPGWVNVDVAPLDGVDVVADLERCAQQPLPFADDCAEEFRLSHVIEHIHGSLALMQELHRLARPGATMTVRCPHGGSDDAWEDPTHVRAYFPDSFHYFSQLAYWRADYGYRGDWDLKRITLAVRADAHRDRSQAEILERIRNGRNAIQEMTAELVAVKPIRAPKAGFSPACETRILLL
jgi:SAM-dependent methyltransferase